MAKEATARARMDEDLKRKAESILAKCGLNATQGINLFYRQIVLHRGLPFDVRIPNAESREAMQEIETGEGLVKFGSAEELLDAIPGASERAQRGLRETQAGEGIPLDEF